MEKTSFEDILSDKPLTEISTASDAANIEAVPDQPEQSTNPEAQDKAQKPRDDKGQFVGKDGAEKPKQDADKDKKATGDKTATPAEEGKTVPLATFLTVRDKLKKAEDLAKSLQNPQQTQSEKKIDPLLNPEDAFNHLQENIGRVERNIRIDLSVQNERAKHADYDEVMDKYWPGLHEANPAAFQAICGSENPGAEAYRFCKNMQFLEESGGDMSALRARIEEEVRAKIKSEAEQTTQPQQQKPERVAVPKSLAKVNSAPVSRSTGPGWNGPTPLSEILKS